MLVNSVPLSETHVIGLAEALPASDRGIESVGNRPGEVPRKFIVALLDFLNRLSPSESGISRFLLLLGDKSGFGSHDPDFAGGIGCEAGKVAQRTRKVIDDAPAGI